MQPAETGGRQLRFSVTDALREKVRDGLPLFPELAHGHERSAVAAVPEADKDKTASLFDFSGCASPREAGMQAWKAIGGDLGRLPEAIRALDEQGYRLDTRRLQNLPEHPLFRRDAFVNAVSQKLQTTRDPEKTHER